MRRIFEPNPVGTFVSLVGSEMEICQIIEEHLREAEANIRLEGGVLSDEDRNLLRDMLRGQISEEDAIATLKSKHGKR